MKKKNQKKLIISSLLITAFALWTVLVRFVDVKAIGPLDSAVGFASLNGFVHDALGVNMTLYTITDLLGLVPIFVVMCFGLLGVVQWIKRKDIRKIDYDILLLGAFYVVVMAVYVLFEVLVINHRPVLIEGVLEASYPSSTTMLCMCVMPTLAMQIKRRVSNHLVAGCFIGAVYLFTAFMVVARLISGVHWFSDIVGGALFSVGVCMMYNYFIEK